MTGDKKYKQDDTVFFLGAGFSSSANIPMTFEFVHEFEKHLEKESNELHNKFIPFLEKLKKSNINGKKIVEILDIEFIYEILHRRLDFKNEVILSFFDDCSPIQETLEEDTAKDLIVELKYLIKNKTNVKPDAIGFLDDFRRFFDNEELVEIYTTNYDNVIEQFCSKFDISFTDGFDLDWKKENFELLDRKLNLFKIHGSIGWYQTFTGKYLKIPIDFEQYCEECQRRKPILKSGEELDDMIMYPMQKWERPGPLLDLMYFLKQRLLSTETKIVYSIGYSFRDDYIRMLFIEALKRNQSLHLFIISPSASLTKERILENQDTTLNLRIIPINSYVEDILMNLDLIRRSLNLAFETESENLKDLRRGAKGNWHKCINQYINSYNFEKAYSIFEKYPYFLDSLGIGDKLNLALNLYMGLNSLKPKFQINEIKDYLEELLVILAESLIIRSPSINVEGLKFDSLFIVERKGIQIRNIHSRFLSLKSKFLYLKNICNNKLNKEKDKEQQYWQHIKKIFDVLDVFDHFLNFWANAIIDKTLLEEHYSKLKEFMILFNVEESHYNLQEKNSFYKKCLEKKVLNEEDMKKIVDFEREFFKLIITLFLD